MLTIRRQDKDRIEQWMNTNHDLIGPIPESSGRSNLFGIDDLLVLLPYITGFLTLLIEINHYAEGLEGLLDKAKRLLQWLHEGRPARSDLSENEKLVAVIFESVRDGATADPERLALLAKIDAKVVKEMLVRLRKAGLLEEPQAGKYALPET